MYQNLLLHTRSKSFDYRWILRPSGITRAQEEALRRIFNNIHKFQSNTSVETGMVAIFCLKIDQKILCFSVLQSGQIDLSGRPISVLQGYVYSDDLSISSSLIASQINEFQNRQMIWDNDVVGGFKGIDAQREVQERSIEIESQYLSDKIENQVTKTKKTEYITFDSMGMSRLLEGIKDKQPVPTFAFGCFPDLDLQQNKFGQCEFIAPIFPYRIDVYSAKIYENNASLFSRVTKMIKYKLVITNEKGLEVERYSKLFSTKLSLTLGLGPNTALSQMSTADFLKNPSVRQAYDNLTQELELEKIYPTLDDPFVFRKARIS